jgi:hypothetical protein
MMSPVFSNCTKRRDLPSAETSKAGVSKVSDFSAAATFEILPVEKSK